MNVEETDSQKVNGSPPVPHGAPAGGPPQSKLTVLSFGAFTADAPASPTGTSPGDRVVRLPVQFIVLNLDQLLIDSRETHPRLIAAFLAHDFPRELDRSAGPPFLPLELRDTTFRSIVAALDESGALEGRLGVTRAEFERRFLGFLRTEYSRGTFHGGLLGEVASPEPITGSRELIELLRDIGIRFRICTDLPRILAELLVERSGFHDPNDPANSLISPMDLVCAGDIPFEDRSDAYWSYVLQSVDRGRCIGIESCPSRVRILLEQAQVRAVVFVPSGGSLDQDSCEAVQRLGREFPDRLVIAQSCTDILRSP